MVKNVQKEKYPQHHTQTVIDKTQPNYPTLTYPIHKTQDRHKNELPSPISKLNVIKTIDRGKKGKK